MEKTKKYDAERRIHTQEQVSKDSEMCNRIISGEISYMICSPFWYGNILYPDKEVSRYRPVEDAIPISFGSHIMAETYLDHVRRKVWWFNILRGINSDKEPFVETWGRELRVVAMWQAAMDRKKFNDYRMELSSEHVDSIRHSTFGIPHFDHG